jgi:hypothetical protein
MASGPEDVGTATPLVYLRFIFWTVRCPMPSTMSILVALVLVLGGTATGEALANTRRSADRA